MSDELRAFRNAIVGKSNAAQELRALVDELIVLLPSDDGPELGFSARQTSVEQALDLAQRRFNIDMVRAFYRDIANDPMAGNQIDNVVIMLSDLAEAQLGKRPKRAKAKKKNDLSQDLLYNDNLKTETISNIKEGYTSEIEAIKALRQDFERYKSRQALLPIEVKLSSKAKKWRGVHAEGMPASEYIKRVFADELKMGLRLSDLQSLDPKLAAALFSEGNRLGKSIDELVEIDKSREFSPARRGWLAEILGQDPDDPLLHDYLSGLTNPHVSAAVRANKTGRGR